VIQNILVNQFLKLIEYFCPKGFVAGMSAFPKGELVERKYMGQVASLIH
jgi:hypothetical protein